MTGIIVLIGVAVGWAIAERRNRRRDLELWRIVKPEISNTAAPTTIELRTYPCPRCGSTNLRGHANNQPMGLTCNVCGWIRYTDPETHTLHDALTQPPWTTAGDLT